MIDLKHETPWEAMFEKETGRFMIVNDFCCFSYVDWDYAYGYDEPDSEDWAVARLMAAAPELLEALENLLKVHEGEGGTQYNAADIARAAIAKAKGEE